MAEPESHTLRLLRELREETREFRADMREFQSATDQNFTAVRRELSDVKSRLDMLAGEIVQSRYTTAGVDDRLAEIERRLPVLERTR